ncbi:unnamed protein product, partial [Allacma fusca]
ESSKSPKKEVQVVKFFDGTLHSVSNPKFIVEYEANKEEHIRSGLSKFISDSDFRSVNLW